MSTIQTQSNEITQDAAHVDAQRVVIGDVYTPDVKPKAKTTKITEKAHLTFNVNAFKTWLRKYYEQNGIEEIPKFRGVHIALSSVCQVLCKELITSTIKQLQKSDSGLYEISRPAIRYAILLDSELEHLFGSALSTFDRTMTFFDNFCIPMKDMKSFVDCEFGGNINIDITAYNLLAYLLAKTLIDFARTSHLMMQYAKKGSLDFNVIIYVIKLKCQSGNLESTLLRHIEDTARLCSIKDKEDDDDDNQKDATTAAQSVELTDAQTIETSAAQSAAQTEAQTAELTDAQTVEPIVAQTEAQTEAPTAAQTDAPTEAQTDAPTAEPTAAQSVAQTVELAETQTAVKPVKKVVKKVVKKAVSPSATN